MRRCTKPAIPETAGRTRSASWILMDYGDVIVHIFDKENRPFYDLERIWNDALPVEIEE